VDIQTAPRPQVAVHAGINGAGKSTAAEFLLRDALKIPSFTNADTIARGLNAFDVEAEAMKAGRIMLEHLSGRAYARWLGEFLRDGYAVHLFYYWLRSPEMAIRRVSDRVAAGGHHVPDETIRRRYSRSVRNFLKLYRPVVTTWQVYDNSHGARRLIAFNNSFFDSVLDPELWAEFNRSADDGGPSDPSGD
jgi:predicted ABC-type ATPase